MVYLQQASYGTSLDCRFVESRQIIGCLMHICCHKSFHVFCMCSILAKIVQNRKYLSISKHIPCKDVAGRRFINARCVCSIGKKECIRISDVLSYFHLTPMPALFMMDLSTTIFSTPKSCARTFFCYRRWVCSASTIFNPFKDCRMHLQGIEYI